MSHINYIYIGMLLRIQNSYKPGLLVVVSEMVGTDSPRDTIRYKKSFELLHNRRNQTEIVKFSRAGGWQENPLLHIAHASICSIAKLT